MTRTPASLLKRLCETGDADVWERFVRLYSPLLFDWARHAGLQEFDAADLVQDVFVILHKELPKFVYEPSKSFRGWPSVAAQSRQVSRDNSRDGVIGIALASRIFFVGCSTK